MKLQSISFNRISKVLSTKKAKAKMPIVATPIVAYYIGKSQDDNAQEIINFFKMKHLEIPNYVKPHPHTKTGISIQDKGKFQKELDKAFDRGEISEQEHSKYSSKLVFTGKNSEVDFDTELTSIDSELATLDSEHARLASDSVSAQEAIESGLLDEVGVSDILDQITDHPGVAVATGVAAELLPGTRFLKPAKDFLDGDFAKAGIGAATRLGEMALGPLKLLWAGGTGLIGGVMGMFHPEDEELGFWKCFKYASMSWAKGRDNIENIFIDRETSGEKKTRLKREAKEKFAEEMRKVEAKKDELKEKRQQLELQEQARRIEAQRRQEELEKLEADLKEKERRHKCYLRERAKRMNPEIQKIKKAQAERKNLKFKEYERAYEELMQIKQQCIMEQCSLKNEQIIKYGKSQAKKRDKHPIMELDYRFVYITKILSQLDSYMKQKHLLEDIQFLDVLRNPSDVALNNLKKIIEQLNEKLGKTSRRSRF